MSDDQFTAPTNGIHADGDADAFEGDLVYFIGLLGVLVVFCLLTLFFV